MNIFIDCEFNGHGGELISMALVSEDGSEFYEVLNLDKNYDYVDWVKKNVVPILNKDPITSDSFKNKLWRFLNKYDDVHVIADWPDDIKYFCQSLITAPGQMINIPNILTMEVDRSLSTESSVILHNALEDARAIKRSFLESVVNDES
jgi:hypothetical protein